MADSEPLVSVGMPVYNGERYIRQALDSLLAQDYENFELIISDNASTDRSDEICQEYLVRDKRVRYYRNDTNVGFRKNFNRVCELSCGQYFMWAAHDDLWDKTFIRKHVALLEQAPSSVVLAFPLTGVINEVGALLRTREYKLDTTGLDRFGRIHVLIQRFTTAMAVYGLIRRAALQRTRLVFTNVGAEYLLLTELAMIGEFVMIPEVLFYKRPPTVSQSVEYWTTYANPLARKSNFPWSLLVKEMVRGVFRFSEARLVSRTLIAADIIWVMSRRYRLLDEVVRGVKEYFNGNMRVQA